MEQVKERSTPITDALLEQLVGKYVHAPVNEFVRYDLMENGDETVNVRLCGLMVGYQKTILHYSYPELSPLPAPSVFYNVMLSDGMSYPLSETALELEVLTEDEFAEALEQHVDEEAFLETPPQSLLEAREHDEYDEDDAQGGLQ